MNSKTCRYEIGELVDASLWDRTWPPKSHHRLGICKVVGIESGRRSQSGFMITVEGDAGKIAKLDQDWFVDVPQN